MNPVELKKEKIWTPQLRNTVLIGFLLRVLMLILITVILNGVWDLYFIEDDQKFEELVGNYMDNANSPFDFDTLRGMTREYIAPFWPWVICIFGKMFGYLYIGRAINVVLSTLCIPVIYSLTRLVSGRDKMALLSARLFAFMPITILIPCFPVKDIFIMLGVLYAFYTFVCFQSSRHVGVGQIILCTALLVGVFFSRGAVTEMMLIFLLVYYLQKLLREKKYLTALFVLAGGVVIFMIFSSSILGAFETKIEDYSTYGAEEAVGLTALKVSSAADMYKLPLAYAFAMLQPMKLELFTIAADTRPWRTVMGYANMTIYPVAVGAWLYMFCKKHNLFFWLSSFIMYSAVIMLSLGVFRHYLFLMPISIINFTLYMDDSHKNYKTRKSLIILSTFGLLFLVFCYSLIKLL